MGTVRGTAPRPPWNIRQSATATAHQGIPPRALDRSPHRRLPGAAAEDRVRQARDVERCPPVAITVLAEVEVVATAEQPHGEESDARQLSSQRWRRANSGASAWTSTAARAARRRRTAGVNSTSRLAPAGFASRGPGPVRSSRSARCPRQPRRRQFLWRLRAHVQAVSAGGAGERSRRSCRRERPRRAGCRACARRPRRYPGRFRAWRSS